jgi:hypothetical protein
MSDNKTNPEIIDLAAEDVAVEDVRESRPAKPTKRLAQTGLIAALALLSAVAGGWFYRDLLSSYFPSDTVLAIGKRMDTIDASTLALTGQVNAVIGITDEMKSKLAAAQAAADEISKLELDSKDTRASIVTLQKALGEVRTSLDAVKTGPVSTSAGADTSGLAARIESLEKDVASLKENKAVVPDSTVLSQSLADLKAKIAAGTPYQSEFDRVQMMVPAAEGLDILQNYAGTGLSNAKGLAADLKTAIDKLPKLESAPAASSQGWWDSATSLFSNLVVVKSSGDVDWPQLALQCVGFAEQGDLTSAVSALEKTEGALPVDLQTWHDKAVARLAVEAALVKTSAAVMRQIAAKG